ncbi:MAG: DNA-binding protein WhiA [Bacilli bacterium]|nr:DNA-binding protein WhiA [Bacilli bacterium]
MSFTSTVKNEISSSITNETNHVSELSALVKTIGTIKDHALLLTTENVSVANHLYQLLKEVYDIYARITVRNGYNFNKNYIYMLEINQRVSFLLNDLAIMDQHQVLPYPKEYIIADDDLIRAYLKGVFLGIGSVNDPSTSRYHLEFLVDTEEYANFIASLLNRYHFNSKVLKRENKYMIYMKEAEKISDFLRLIQANQAVLYYENIRIYREQKNMANRLNNCEQANVDKSIQTAANLIHDITLLEEVGALELLDEKVYEVAIYRRRYPEASLGELSKIISIETGSAITKSGLHHRLNKIKDMAHRIREKQE